MPREMYARTERAVARGLAVIRVAQFISFAPAAVTGNAEGYRWPTLAVGLYFVAAAWSVVLFAFGLRRRTFTMAWVVVDVAFMTAAAVVIGRASLPGGSFTVDNWTTGPVTGAAVLAVVYGSRSFAAAALATLTAGHLAGMWPDLDVPGGIGSVAGHVVSMIGFSIAGGFLTAFLRKSARKSDELAFAASQAQREEAAMRARLEERTRQYRLLHDTVLSTLSAIGRGGLDHRTKEVQERCARDAAYLRGLITGGADDMPTTLGAALAAVIRDQRALDLDVQPMFDALPKEVPEEVVAAFAAAVREALNNVAKHARTRQAWLTAIGDDDGAVAVTVVDRGVGARAVRKAGGLGIEGSIRDRMREVGGAAQVHTAPDEGTTVELQWPA